MPSSNVLRSVTSSFCSEFSFQTTARDGAVLVMPDGGLSEELQNLKLVDKYITANIKSWWQYVESDDCGVQTDNGLQVVVGTDKVPSWGMATFENVEGPMHFEFKHDRISSQIQTYTWKRINGRAGPAEREIRDLLMGANASPVCNQCVFVRTLNVSVSSKVQVELAAHEVCTSGQRNINIQTSKAGPSVSFSILVGTSLTISPGLTSFQVIEQVLVRKGIKFLELECLVMLMLLFTSVRMQKSLSLRTRTGYRLSRRYAVRS